MSDDDLGCGCETGKRYEFHFDCIGCMARHYTLVLGGTTPTNIAQRKARYKQLEKAWPADRFAEWWKLVLRERANGTANRRNGLSRGEASRQQEGKAEADLA